MGLVMPDHTDIPIVGLYDGDILLYRAGFAAEKRKYYLRAKHVGGSAPSFATAIDAKEYCKQHGLNYKTDIVAVREPEPVENAKHNINKIISGTEEMLKKEFGTAGPVYSYVFLTGCKKEENFRTIVDPTYKAHRDASHKPTHMEELIKHLKDNYSTIESEGCEADDMMGQAQKDAYEKFGPESRVVVVSLDKDLRQLEGYHYDFVKKSLSIVCEEDGLYTFFKQMLMGDATDNIKGIPQIGDIKSAKILANCETGEELYRETFRMYQHHFGDNAVEQWNKNCDLLWIWRAIPDECPYKISTRP